MSVVGRETARAVRRVGQARERTGLAQYRTATATLNQGQGQGAPGTGASVGIYGLSIYGSAYYGPPQSYGVYGGDAVYGHVIYSA